ncbi:TPA: lvrE [Legionella pneumophila]
MKKVLNTSLILATTFGFSQALWANPASTEYVNSHITDAVNSVTAAMQKEVNTLLTQINNQRITTHEVGEHYQGGIIFFVDSSRLHGLIAATHDANNGEGIQWQNGEAGEKVVNARASGIGAGQSNTRLIIAQQTIDYQQGTFAALVAANFSVSSDGNTPCSTTANNAFACYGDWYLPSIYELDLMRLNVTGANQLMPVPYWSSTEASVTESWVEDFGEGAQRVLDKSQNTPHVRAIRAF